MYKPSRHINSFYVAGFQYWDGALVLDKLKSGKKLKLVAEFDNPYDSNAVALYYKKTKIGFVPRDMNWEIASMLRFGHNDVFEARIQQVDPQAEPKRQVRVAILVTDATKSKK
ncbi:HIRAN domain-containing protein [Slackia heliotrinireducens]|uniref:HIRAN domain-containing protein n=1 Tax=Slackia heliotrinireducens TaxID=84110 RepID=UPI00331556C6